MNHSVVTALSVALLVVGVFLYKKTNASKVTTGIFFVIVFSSMLLFITYGVADYFTGNGIDEATMYHLKYGLEGVGFLGYSWLIGTVITALMLGTFCLLLIILKWKTTIEPSTINGMASFSVLSISLLLNPASIDIYNLQKNSLVFDEQLNQENPTSFYQYYRNPYIKSLKSSNKNLVFIYAESLERTYFDKTIFPDLIKGIRELEEKSTYFTNIKQVDGTGWTVGGDDC